MTSKYMLITVVDGDITTKMFDNHKMAFYQMQNEMCSIQNDVDLYDYFDAKSKYTQAPGNIEYGYSQNDGYIRIDHFDMFWKIIEI